MHAHTTVLVVDDNPSIVYLLQEILHHAGYYVVTAVAREAQELARELQPAVILLDISMPGMDGVELCRCLHTDPRTGHMPVIAISGRLNLRLHAAQMGAEAYLPKPFELPELLQTVETLARTGRSPLPAGV